MSTYNVFYFRSVIDRSGSPISVFRDRAVFSGSLEDVLSKAYDSFYPGDVYATISDRNTEATVARLQSDGMASILSDKYGMDKGQIQVEHSARPQPIADQPKKRFMGLFDEGGSVELLAPNGQPSNLSPEQYKLVRTSEFKAWFGDWENDPNNASKVVDENGEPLVVYHGTKNKDFFIFEKQKKISNPYLLGNDNSVGHFFTQHLDRAKSFGKDGRVIKSFINLREPYLFTSNTYARFANDVNDGNEMREQLKALGYSDGFIIDDFYTICVYEPNQIKLADGSNTTFDGENPDIRFDEGGQLSISFDQPTFEHGGEILGITLDEAVLLYIKMAILPPYRENYLKPIGMYKTDKANQVENSLKRKGYLNAAGSINQLGKEKAKEVDKRLNDKIHQDFVSALNKQKAYNELKDEFASKFENGGYMARGGGIPITPNFEIENDDERTKISIKGVGRVILTETYPEYEFLDDVNEDTLEKLGIEEGDLIGKIEHLEIKNEYKGKGYAKLLMSKAIQIAKKRNLFPLYLNASPMGYDGLRLKDLTSFYEKFGFEVFLHQGGNNLMILKNQSVKMASGGYMAKGGLNKDKKYLFRTKVEGVFGEYEIVVSAYNEEDALEKTRHWAFDDRAKLKSEPKKTTSKYVEGVPMTLNQYWRIFSDKMEKGGEFGIDKHRVYFSSFAEVMEAINDIAEDNGYEIKEIFPDLSYGGVSYGQTKRARVELEWNGKEKRGKSKKRESNTLNVQIYRMDSGNYELNTYFSYEKGGYMAKGGEIKIIGDAITDEFGLEKNDVIRERDVLDVLRKQKNRLLLYKGKFVYNHESQIPNFEQIISDLKKDGWNIVDTIKMASGGKVTFDEKVKAIKKSLLKRKKVSPKVQKDYGKTYSPKEAEESAKRIAGAMTAKERVKARLQNRSKK